MKPVVLWSVLPSLLWSGSALAGLRLSPSSSHDDIIPNKFIVEVDAEAHIPNKRSFVRDLDAIYASIHSRDVTFEVEREFDAPGLFVGATISLETTDDIVALEALPGIKAIRPLRRFDRPRPVVKYVAEGVDDPKLPPFGTATHVITGVDKLHQKGIFGKGVTVAVLDTGIDYLHPFLGGGIGPGHKVIGGYDFVGDDYDGSNTPYPDDDPLDKCDGHGTHVAGIVGVDGGNEYNLTGVAPQASILGYRIFGCDGFTSDDIIIAGLLRGVNEGADILTMSLGGAHGWTVSSSAIVASRIAESGKIVTIAAGNDGGRGAWYAASPSTSINAISVGSTENVVVPLQQARLYGADRPGPIYYSLKPLAIEGRWPIYVLSNDTTKVDDACEPLPDDTPDLSKYVTIIRRGTCFFVDKLQHVADKGGNYTLIYDNGTGFTAIGTGNFTTALIQAADGKYIVDSFFAGAKLEVEFPQTGGTVSYPNPSGGLMSNFSSYGPTNDFYFKPAISAPGGGILNAYPTTLGTFAVLSGTSMATPFAAGAAALYLEIKGKSPEAARAARNAFETTARSVQSSSKADALTQSATVAGAGLLNAYDAILSQTIVSPGELILNDTAHFRGTHKISITNTGNTAKIYKLSHSPAGTALTVKENSASVSLGPVPLSDSFATVSISPSEIAIKAGQTKEVTIRITPPSGIPKARFPVYSGYVLIDNGIDIHRVTYLGLAANLRDKQILDTSDEWIDTKLPALVLAKNEEPIEGPANFTFINGDFPLIVYRLTFGTPKLRIDLVASDTRIYTTLNPRDIPTPADGGNMISFPEHIHPGTFTSVPIVGNLWEFNYLNRNSEVEGDQYNIVGLSQPLFSNGTLIPRGSYKILIRALKVTGNRERQEDYETWASPVIGIGYPELP